MNALPAIVNGQTLPDGWKAIAVRWLSRRYSGGTPDKNLSYYWNDGTIPWLNSGAVNQGVIRQPSDFITEEGFANSSAKWMPRGSVVMALAGQGKTKAMVGYLDIETTGNQSLAAIVPSAIEGKFLYWWLTSQYRHIRNLSSQDGRDGLNLEMLGSIRCPVPSLEAQERIAAFLDEKTAQIDGLIAKKQALLERLAEKRQAIITQAITKGLNPSAPMKDSGIDWLGQIPAHWEVRSLRFAVENLNRMRIPIAAELRKGIERLYPYYGASGIIDYVDEYIFDFPTVLVAEDGANLLSRSTPLAFPADGQYWVNNHAHILRPTSLSIWFCAALLALYPLDPHISGSAQPKLTKDALMSLPVWVPPLDEQALIEEAVIGDLSAIDPVIEKCSSSVEKLIEYRSALITAAVTGQIAGLQ